MKRLLQLLSAAALVLTMSAPGTAAAGDGPGILPVIPKAVKGDKCVEDTAVMRRRHMDFLKHQRDETMHKGIRTSKYSLKNCLECHATEQTADAVDGHAPKGHFCENCHAYAGVTIDCFECHATKPEKNAAFHPMVSQGTEAMKAADRPDSGELLNQLAGANENKAGAANE